MRRQLDDRLHGLDQQIGERPANGWLNSVRRALYMSTAELAVRMSISQSRASRLERAEVQDSLRLSTLRRAAEALNCRLFYILVPVEPFEDMVLRQADLKAEEEVAVARSFGVGPWSEDERDEQVEARTLALVDSRGLWRVRQADEWGPHPT